MAKKKVTTKAKNTTKTVKAQKWVYCFGGGKADGNESMKNLLGGKGANLAEMAGHRDLRLPVPPGFTLTTEVCVHYYAHRRSYPEGLKYQVETALKKVEDLMERKFGDPVNPLLVSVRSGARKSMPGMMETVLNIGLKRRQQPFCLRCLSQADYDVFGCGYGKGRGH